MSPINILFVGSVFNGGILWNRAVDVADIVTALAASLAVILATWLSLKAIKIAKGDNNRSEQEFLYTQANSMLESALALIAAAKDLETDPSRHVGEDQRALRRCAESFESRIRVLESLKLIKKEPNVAAENSQHFAHALVKVGLARQELNREGRAVLKDTLFAERDDALGTTAELLSDLAQRVHGTPEGTVATGGGQLPVRDGRDVSRAFDGSEASTARLRERLERLDSLWSQNESLRLVLPWIRVKLDWWVIQEDGDGSPYGIYTFTKYDDYLPDVWANQTVQAAWPKQVVEDWLKAWPSRYWQDEDMTEMLREAKDYEGPLFTKTPEELIDDLLSDLSAEFIDRLLELVVRRREGLPEL